MSTEGIIAIVVALIGSGGIWKAIQASAENSILARQARETINAKNNEIAELKRENSTLWGKNTRLNEREDELLDLLAACEARHQENGQ